MIQVLEKHPRHLVRKHIHQRDSGFGFRVDRRNRGGRIKLWLGVRAIIFGLGFRFVDGLLSLSLHPLSRTSTPPLFFFFFSFFSFFFFFLSNSDFRFVEMRIGGLVQKLGWKIWIRLSSQSVVRMFPRRSTAIPLPPLNWPSPLPSDPNLQTNSPRWLKTCTR